LRSCETWETTRHLTAKLIHFQYHLSAREPKLMGQCVANPSFIEEIMGYPTGYTDLPGNG